MATSKASPSQRAPRWWDLAFGVVVGVLLGVILLEALWLTLRVPPGEPIRIVTVTPAALQVHVTGAVARPGVYALPPGSRVQDALQAAGGPTEDADLERLNLARRLQDGEQVRVPRRSTPQPPALAGTATPAASPEALKININTATAQELEALPGIGPTLAQRIVAYREANGPFTSIEQLLEVKGIGPVLLEKIRPYIFVEVP